MNTFRKTAIIFTALILSFLVYVELTNNFMRIPAPYMHWYGENSVLVSSWGWATGHGLYRLSELERVPVFISPYTPLAYLIFTTCIRIWGITYIPGRLIMFMAMLGCAGMITAISRRQGSKILPSIMAGAIFTVLLPVSKWTGHYRMDFLALLFELIAVYILLGRGTSMRRSIAFVLTAVLAGYTKQQAFGLVVGALLGLIFFGDREKRKYFITLGTAYAFCAIVVFAIIEILTRGAFHKIVIGSFRTSLYWGPQIEESIGVFSEPLTPCITVFGFIGAVHSKKYRWLAPCILLSFLITVRLLLVRGGTINYFIEPLSACCIGAAILLNSTESHIKQRNWATLTVYGILSFCVINCVYQSQAYLFVIWPWKYVDSFKLASQPKRVLFVLKNFCSPGSLVLTDMPDMPLFAGCIPMMSDPLLLTIMAEDGKWNPDPVVKALQEKRIALVLMMEKVTYTEPMVFLPKEVARAVLENYRQVPIKSQFNLYLPKKDEENNSSP